MRIRRGKKKTRSKRQRGGQRGHLKCQRPLAPADDCDELVPLKPTTCRRCGTPLHGDDPQPLRHQVWELPEIRPLITEYQRHRLDCPGCGESTCAPLPAGVPTGQSGPRLVALTGLMMAYLRQGRRRTALFLETVFSVPCSTGLTVKQQMLVTQAARPAYEELSAALPQQSHISADETPTKEASAMAWLWTFRTDRFTVYALAKGGQRKPREVRLLVIEIAKTTGFGYTRIIGELRKLGIRKISRQTVRNILKEEGIEPGPDRTSDSWDNFIERHARSLWAVDFFSVKTVTAMGFRELYVMVWLCMTTREIIVSESTQHPNSEWVVEQTEVFLDRTLGREVKPSIVMHDRDSKFSRDFVAKLKQHGVRNNALPKASPNLNGRCERAIQTLRRECLSKFIVFGKRHLDHLLTEFADYYNTVRSSMVRDHLPPVRDTDPGEIATLDLEQVEVKSYVGGLVKAFQRKAA